LKRINLFFAVLTAILLSCIPALADTFTLSTANRGWITSTGTSNGTSGANSYYTGIDFSYNAGAELRDWFSFDLSTVSGTITSATIQVASGTYIPYQTTSETLQLTSVAAQDFADLGTGTVYGTQVYSAAENAQTVTITLDAAAITALNNNAGGTFELGGRLTSLQQTAPGTANEAIFSTVSGDPAQVQLVLNTTGTGGGGQGNAPEPASMLLFITVLAAIPLLRKVGNQTPGR